MQNPESKWCNRSPIILVLDLQIFVNQKPIGTFSVFWFVEITIIPILTELKESLQNVQNPYRTYRILTELTEFLLYLQNPYSTYRILTELTESLQNLQNPYRTYSILTELTDFLQNLQNPNSKNQNIDACLFAATVNTLPWLKPPSGCTFTETILRQSMPS